jgi:plasmid stabilization system protein ParE
MHKVVLNRPAVRDLERLLNESVERYGVERGARTKQAWADAIRFLSEFPRAGSSFDSTRKGLRRHVVQPHAAYYLIRGDEVRVVRILHVRQDPNGNL